jgi:hypothetical protein
MASVVSTSSCRRICCATLMDARLREQRGTGVPQRMKLSLASPHATAARVVPATAREFRARAPIHERACIMAMQVHH